MNQLMILNLVSWLQILVVSVVTNIIIWNGKNWWYLEVYSEM